MDLSSIDTGIIAALSTDLAMAKTQQAVGIALTKKVMNAQEAQAAQLLQQMTPPASFGHRLDIYA